uniref:Nebulette n=1 Tax=Cyprinus carpio TaxID=7962 RepID=A0A8C1Z4P6_CYPCA
MPQTIETVFAKEVSKQQSDKLYKEKFNSEKGKSNYSQMKDLPDVSHAIQVNKHQSNVAYRRGKEELHKFSEVMDRPDIRTATHASKLASDVAYRSKLDAFDQRAMLERPDIQHAQEATRLASQVNYKQKFEKNLREQKPQYNPSECVSFRHIQAASALASQVKYSQKKLQAVTDLPNLLHLGHALHASKLQSNVEYRKKYEESKGQYLFALDTAEQRHHQENAVLHSQWKYKEEYEKNRGKSQMEFVDTQTYKVSKEAQKMQSEKEYRKDLESEIRGKGTDVTADSLEIQRAKKASEISSDVSYRQASQHRESSYSTVTDTPALLHAAYLRDVYSQKKYRGDMERLKGSCSAASDTPEIQRVKNNQRNISALFYTWDSRLMKGLMSAITDSPEIKLARENTKNISDVQYRESVGSGTAVTDTPEMERVRRNQHNISDVSLSV